MADPEHSSSNMSEEAQWDPIYKCYRVGDALYRTPIQYAPPPQPQPPPPEQEQHAESSVPAQRQRRPLGKASVESIKSISFRLFKCQCDEIKEYILEMHEAATDKKTHYTLNPFSENKKSKVKAKEFQLEDRVVIPMREEVNHPIDSKYKLSLIERMEGNWRMELRRRDNGSKIDKFYYHQKVKRTFRSFNDVATFILYGVSY